MEKSRTTAPIITTATAMNLRSYVEEYWSSYIAFGRALRPTRKYSATGKMLSLNYVVVNKCVYSYRQSLLDTMDKYETPTFICDEAEGIEFYIYKRHNSLRDFGQSLTKKMLTADVKSMIEKRYIVIKHCLYSYRFDLPEVIHNK